MQSLLTNDLAKQTQETLAKYDHALLRRAAAFLYLKETQSSFEVEREKPSPQRAQRFADLLREAETNTPLSEERLVDLQNSVVDPRFREASYRAQQNWLGDDLGFRKRIALVPPRPDDARALMDGLVAMSESLRQAPSNLDPIVAAASLSFGFVFIHPFMDGNGRLHRYLIHEASHRADLRRRGLSCRFLPSSLRISMPTSLPWKRSRSRSARAPPGIPTRQTSPPSGNDAVYFRYFDATAQTEFLGWALQRTIEHDLDRGDLLPPRIRQGQ